MSAGATDSGVCIPIMEAGTLNNGMGSHGGQEID